MSLDAVRAHRFAKGVFVIGMFALPGAAHARGTEVQSTAVFAVAKDPSGQKAAAAADALLRTHAAKTKGIRLIEPGRVLSGDPRTKEEEALERARTALADGRRAYDALKLDEAIARLGQAINLFQQTGPLLGDLDEFSTALAYLGGALTLRGSADEGESTFVELITINPSYQLERFPPVVLKAFDAASRRVERAPTGSVEIYSTPPYAAVYLDGRLEGVTPVVLSDLVAGTHYLRIEKLGYTTYGAALEVSSKQRVTSQTRLRNLKRGVELRDLAARASDELGQEGMGGSLRNLARTLSADNLVFVNVSQSGKDATFVGGVFDAATGSRIATESAVLAVEGSGYSSDLAAFVDRLLSIVVNGTSGTERSSTSGSGGLLSSDGSSDTGRSLLGAGGMTPPDAGLSRSAPPMPSNETHLGWALVGVGAAGVVNGIVFGILAKKALSDYKATPQASPDLGHLRDVGKTDALVADLSLAGGILSATAGVIVLLVLNNRQPTPEELLRSSHAGIIPTDHGAVLSFGGELP